MTDFNAVDPATWPLSLTAEQTAAIYQRSVGGLKKSCQLGRCVPAPYQTHPYRWKKAAILRHLDADGRVTAFRRTA